MNNLSMKMKFLLVALIPMIIATIATLGIVVDLQRNSLEIEIEKYQETLTEERKSNIHDASLIAQAVVEEVVARLGTGEDAKRAINQAISNARYADNAGYFFIFDADGDYLVHSLKPAVEGKSGIGLTDPNGVKITQEMRKLATNGGGFMEYIYDKPGFQTPQPKIAYSSPIAKSGGWFMGTGLYTDDIIKATTDYAGKAKEQMNQQIKTVVMISLVLIVIVVFLMFYISSKITAPITTMLNNFNDIASGEGDLTYRIKAAGSDEIAQLGNAFDLFLDKLHGIISDVAKVTSHVSSAASSIDSQTTTLQKQLQDHNEETELVVTAITEMNSTAQEVARNANEVATATTKANEDSQHALRLVDVSTRSISSLENNIKQSGDNMTSLKEQSQKIDGVLKVIGEIAEQTNLLALNAAIEAARAGEQGRGFAVVADEVRNLASRTQGSTLEIKQMLDELHSYVQHAVSSMDDSRASCGEVVNSSSDIVGGLNSVGDAVETINSMTDQIATAATEQSSVTDEINQNLVTIRSIVTSLLESNHSSTLIASELTDAGQSLNKLVSQFKL